jgi:hypothetical protein
MSRDSPENITYGPTVIVTNEEHRFLVLDQLRELRGLDVTLLLEPVGRNTAAASTYVMELDKKTYDQQTEPMQSHINVGFGSDVTISELAHAVAKATGYQGSISFDPSKPDGTLRKWMDSSRLNQLGWTAKNDLTHALQSVYKDYLELNPQP